MIQPLFSMNITSCQVFSEKLLEFSRFCWKILDECKNTTVQCSLLYNQYYIFYLQRKQCNSIQILFVIQQFCQVQLQQLLITEAKLSSLSRKLNLVYKCYWYGNETAFLFVFLLEMKTPNSNSFYKCSHVLWQSKSKWEYDTWNDIIS